MKQAKPETLLAEAGRVSMLRARNDLRFGYHAFLHS